MHNELNVNDYFIGVMSYVTMSSECGDPGCQEPLRQKYPRWIMACLIKVTFLYVANDIKWLYDS